MPRLAMTKLIALFTTSLVVGFSGALMPGPLLTVVISGSARRGFWEGPSLVLGHAVAEALIVVALAAGLSRLLKRNLVAGLIGLLGGAFLLWMGFDIARSAWWGTVSLEQATGAEAGLQLGPVITGIVVSISNPYWVLWWATVGASYVALSLERGPLGLGAVYSGHILSDLSWYSLVAFLIARGKTLLNQSVYRLILLVCGLFLIALSIYFIYSGINLLRGKAVALSSSD
jgi:threonine/homoserine/homoserine lactone efflux protein